MRVKYAFYALPVLVFLLSSCTKNANQPTPPQSGRGYVPLACNQDFMPDETRNFGERAETEHIGDMYIGDFKIIADSISLNHEQFRTNNIWNEKVSAPVLDTELKNRYRTILNNASFMEPDFDGKYKIVSYGAGTGFTGYFILDLNTGTVHEPNVYSYFGADYNVSSSLLVINPPEEVVKYWEYEYGIIPGWVQVEYMAIVNGKLRTLLAINLADDN